LLLTDYYLVYKRTYLSCLEVLSEAMAAYMGLLGLFEGAFSQYWQSDFHWSYQCNQFFHQL